MADKIFHTWFNQKTNPVWADKLMISDSQASNETKYADLDSLPISTATQTALNGKQNTIWYNPLQSVIAWTNVTIDNTNPLNPVINSTWWWGSWDVTASWTLTNDTIILWWWTTTVKTSSKTIVTTLWTDDLTLPTSKAVKDVTDWKVTWNIAITGATKTKITYDSKGLVTSWANATTADIADSTDKRYVTDAQLTVIWNTSWTNTWNQTSIVWITWTKAEFDTAVSDWNICFDWDAVTNLTMSTNKLLGRSTASTWNVEEITLGTWLSFSGTTLNATASWWDATNNIWYLNIPQNSQSTAYTLVLTDAWKHIYHPSADTTARTWTIPANSSVAYPIWTAITFVNDTSWWVITISITDDTLVLAWAWTTWSRTLRANWIATAIKVTSARWQISWTNLT